MSYILRKLYSNQGITSLFYNYLYVITKLKLNTKQLYNFTSTLPDLFEYVGV